jgi:hypothetical protein
MNCWKCGKECRGQICEECFNELKREYELKQEEEWINWIREEIE